MSKEGMEYTLEKVSQMATEAALVKGYHIPLLVVEGNLNTIVLALDELAETHAERAQQLFFIATIMAQTGKIGVLQQVFFVSEGWLSMTEDGNPPKQRPSQDPNRKEILLVSQLQVEEEKADMHILEMKRDKKGELRSLEALPQMNEQTQVRSPLLNAFAQGFLGVAQGKDD